MRSGINKYKKDGSLIKRAKQIQCGKLIEDAKNVTAKINLIYKLIKLIMKKIKNKVP